MACSPFSLGLYRRTAVVPAAIPFHLYSPFGRFTPAPSVYHLYVGLTQFTAPFSVCSFLLGISRYSPIWATSYRAKTLQRMYRLLYAPAPRWRRLLCGCLSFSLIRRQPARGALFLGPPPPPPPLSRGVPPLYAARGCSALLRNTFSGFTALPRTFNIPGVPHYTLFERARRACLDKRSGRAPALLLLRRTARVDTLRCLLNAPPFCTRRGVLQYTAPLPALQANTNAFGPSRPGIRAAAP